MSVLYISHMEYIGGAETFLETLIANNPAVRARVFVSSREFSERLKSNGAEVYFSKNFGKVNRQKPGWPFRFIKIFIRSFLELRRIIGANGVDIVHANGAKAAMYSFLPALFCRKPFLWTCNDIFLPANNRMGRIINLLYGKTIVVSEVSKNIFKYKKPELIYYGIDLKRFDPDIHPKGFIRNRYSIPSQRIVIGVVGVLNRIKGFHIVLEAADILKTSGFADKFICLFIGSEGEGQNYNHWLQTQIRRRGLENNIIIMGYIKDIEKVYADLDILVSPSIVKESFGLAAAEAMAMKKIVVASDMGGLKELIDNGRDGFLIPAGDPASLAAQLKELIENFSSFENIRENARRKVASNFSAEKMVSGYNSLYREIKDGGYKRI